MTTLTLQRQTNKTEDKKPGFVQRVTLILLRGRGKRTKIFTALIIPRQCPLVLVARTLHITHKLP